MKKEIPAVVGYYFVCRNKDCQYKNTGFSLYKEWPIANIDDVISSKAIKDYKDLKEHLIKTKGEGRKYALITLPNNEKIKVVGKRVQLICFKDYIIWERDLINKSDTLDMSCDKCKSKLISAEEAKKNGIICPSCKIRLLYNTWFSQI